VGAPYVGVIGASEPTESQFDAAEVVGRALARGGATVITGGRGGVMAAASKGAAQAGGTTVGLLPGEHRSDANEHVQVAIATGLGELRNGLIVRSADALVAVGGSYGTLSEIALALRAGVPVVGFDTWEIEGVERAQTPEAAASRALELAVERAP
jgi:uncharacterized protein (TIGR00725 family)